MTLTSADLLDLFADLFDGFLFIIFFTAIFKHKYNKAITSIGVLSGSLISFVAIVITTFFGQSSVSNNILNYIGNYLLYILIFFTYCLIFLNGKKSLMFIMVILSLVINSFATLIVLVWLYFNLTLITRVPISFIVQNGFFKAHLIVLSHILVVLAFWWIVQKTSKKNFSIKRNDIVIFIIIPLLIETMLDCCILIIAVKKDRTKLLIVLSIIIFISITIAIIYSVMFSQIRKNYRLKTEYLLTKQKMNLYEENVIKSGKQIEKMSKIKHDMKNYLLSIGTLISSRNYEEAEKLCTEISENLQKVYTPINTENILLNAIVNVELDKAENENIDFNVEISDCLSKFSGNPDIISIIGNICDNAIEYLKTQPGEKRIMSLEISDINYRPTIICRNKINYLISNGSSCSKDTEILKSICSKYNGNFSYREDGGYLIATVTLN